MSLDFLTYEAIDQIIFEIIEKNKSVPEALSDRIEIIKSFSELLKQNKDGILETYRLEQGRSGVELDFEWSLCTHWLERTLRSDFSSLHNTTPKGLVLVLASYYQPLFYFIQFFVLSFLSGNSCIYKPAESSHQTVQVVAQLFFKVSNLVHTRLRIIQGDQEVGRRLSTHQEVKVVIFCGSYENGIRVKQDTISQVHKEVLLFLSTKNAAIITEGVTLENIKTHLIHDAFLFAGQSCRSLSHLYVPASRFAETLDLLHELAKGVAIGYGQNDFMGALSEKSVVDRYLKFGGMAEREGASMVMRGKILDQKQNLTLVTPTLVSYENLDVARLQKSIVLQSALGAPFLSVSCYQKNEEITSFFKKHVTGLQASVWGESLIVDCQGLGVGLVIRNQRMMHESSFLASFQARKRTGNHAFYGLKLIEQLVYF